MKPISKARGSSPPALGLCRQCFARQVGSNTRIHRLLRIGREDQCHICGGLFQSIPAFTDRILLRLKEYNFSTYQIGATIPSQLLEREDEVRAAFKLIGEGLKTAFVKALNGEVARRLGRKSTHRDPDLTAVLRVQSEEVNVSTKPALLMGRYVKKRRGMPQRSRSCPVCRGKGCESCNRSGRLDTGSVEDMMAMRILDLTGGRSARFSWIGHEDPESLVLGGGRPFLVRVSSPKQTAPEYSRPTGSREDVELVSLEPWDGEFRAPPFRTAVRCRVIIPEDTGRKELEAALGKMSGGQVRVIENGRPSKGLKKVHSARLARFGKGQATVDLELDGGLPVKGVVEGPSRISRVRVEPSLAELLDREVQCRSFDVIQVIISERA